MIYLIIFARIVSVVGYLSAITLGHIAAEGYVNWGHFWVMLINSFVLAYIGFGEESWTIIRERSQSR